MIGQTVSHYRILKMLGSGGMGEVFLAEDTSLHRKVALKFLPPDTQQDPSAHGRVLREARSAAGLEHTNICTIHEVGRGDGKDFIVMEYIDGRTLRELLAQGALPLPTALRIMMDIAEALDEAHEKGIIHRDLKPANIMITRKGHAKVMDFGLATQWTPAEGSQSDANTISTLAGSSMPGGTLAYMSPEQLLGKPIGPQSDIFSLGIVFFETLTGQHPFRASTLLATSDRILHERPTPLSKVNPEIPEIIGKLVEGMLAKSPDGRPAGARELLKELHHASAAENGVRAAPKWISGLLQHSWKLILAISGILLLVLFAGILLLRPAYRQKAKGLEIPSKIHLAVLPFETDDSTRDMAHFAKGLAENLNNMLTKITERHSLQVVPASEIRRSNVSTPEEAREEFGANLALKGKLQKTKERLGINYAIVDTKTNRALRSDTIMAAIVNPFEREDLILASVLQNLGVELEEKEKNALGNRGTRQPSAYDYYAQARGYLRDYEKLESVQNAIDVFNSALKQDPGYAMAYAGLGEAHWHQYRLTNDLQRIRDALRDCNHAVTLDSGCATGHICLGVVYTGTGRYEEAVSEFQHAVSLEPTNDDACRGLGSAYDYLGKFGEAEKTYRQAIELRPQYWAGYNCFGSFYKSRGRYSEAAKMFAQVVRLAPDSFVGYSNLGGIYVLQGLYDEAIRELEHSVSLKATSFACSNLGTLLFFRGKFSAAASHYEKATQIDKWQPKVWGNLADAYYWAGMRPQATGAYRKAVSLGEEKLRVNARDSDLLGFMAYYHAMLNEREKAQSYALKAIGAGSGDPEISFNLALAFCKLGEEIQAMDYLKKAIAEGFSRATVEHTPLLEHLRETPGYQRLFKEN
jgi:serine/threonine protein kinase/Flp pilus assembly protein TadD